MKAKHIAAITVYLIIALTIPACESSENQKPDTQITSEITTNLIQSSVSDTGHTSSKLDNVLPFGLKFGDSYEEFADKLKKAGLSDAEIPQLEEAQNNNGYVALPQFYFLGVKADDYLGYTVVGSDISKSPATMRFAFSFNQNKELYEWYWFGGDLELNEEAQVEYALNCQLEAYNDVFGFDGSYSEENDEIVCRWETNTITAELSLSNNTLSLIFHSIEHDLNH